MRKQIWSWESALFRSVYLLTCYVGNHIRDWQNYSYFQVCFALVRKPLFKSWKPKVLEVVAPNRANPELRATESKRCEIIRVLEISLGGQRFINWKDKSAFKSSTCEAIFHPVKLLFTCRGTITAVLPLTESWTREFLRHDLILRPVFYLT